MINSILIVFSILLAGTSLWRIAIRRQRRDDFIIFSYFLTAIASGFLLLVTLSADIGGESTPIWVTTVNSFKFPVKTYLVVTYDTERTNHENDVYKVGKLIPNDSNETVIEYNGAKEVWTAAIDEHDSLVHFSIYNGYLGEKYKTVLGSSSVIELAKSEVALRNIETFNRSNFTKNLFFYLDLILIAFLITDLLTKNARLDNLEIDESKTGGNSALPASPDRTSRDAPPV